MSIVSPCLFRYGYTSPACSNLAQEFSVPSTFICRKKSLEHVDRELFSRHGSRFVSNRGSRQGKLRSQNLDEAR